MPTRLGRLARLGMLARLGGLGMLGELGRLCMICWLCMFGWLSWLMLGWFCLLGWFGGFNMTYKLGPCKFGCLAMLLFSLVGQTLRALDWFRCAGQFGWFG